MPKKLRLDRRNSRGYSKITKRITKIPDNILDENISFAEFGAKNFDSICHTTRIKNKRIVDQFLIGKSKNYQKCESSFNGLKMMTDIQLENVDNSILKKKDENSFYGLGMFLRSPPKSKHIVYSDMDKHKLKNPYDHCVGSSVKYIPDNCECWINSTIKRTRRLNFNINFDKKYLSISIISLFWFLIIGGLFFFLRWKFLDVPLENQEESEFFSNNLFVRFGELILEDTEFRIALAIFAFLLIVGIIVLIRILIKKKSANSNSLNLKSEGIRIAERKDEEAHVNYDEEKERWGRVKHSFSVLVKGKNVDEIKFFLESLKIAIEGIYFGCTFRLEGKTIIQGEKNFQTLINCLFGWSLNSFWKSFEEVKPYKPTIMSVPRAGRNFFRLIQEKFIPGSNIIEGLSYKIPIDRTKHGLYLGEIYQKVSGKSYPFYIKPQDLVRHAFVFGQTGRGKSFFVYHLLTQLIEFYPDIKALILDPKGEYARLFAKREDTIVFIIDSKVAPLGINIFKILEDVEENKLLVSNLLREYIITVKGYQSELSAYMEYVINQAIDLVYLEPPDEWHMQTFVLKINQYLDEKAEEKIGWTEKTRLALNARFRELFTGRFKDIFCVKESNITKELLQTKNIIIQMHKLLLKQEEETLQFLASVITSIVSNYMEGLHDLELDIPRYVYVIDELRVLVPKRTFEKTSFVARYLEIARAHRIAILGSGQNPDLIDQVFQQSGIIIDFGTNSTVMDKVVFEKDHIRAPEEKEQLAPEQMCFLRLVGERRVLLRVADFDYSQALKESEIETIIKG